MTIFVGAGILVFLTLFLHFYRKCWPGRADLQEASGALRGVICRCLDWFSGPIDEFNFDDVFAPGGP